MKHYLHTIAIFILTVATQMMAQGVTFPTTPSQAPIGGLGLLAAIGGAMAYKILKKK